MAASPRPSQAVAQPPPRQSSPSSPPASPPLAPVPSDSIAGPPQIIINLKIKKNEKSVQKNHASVASKHLHAHYHSHRVTSFHPHVAERHKSHPRQVQGRRSPPLLHALRPVPQRLGHHDLRPQPQAAPLLSSPSPARQVESHRLLPQHRRDQGRLLLLHPIKMGRNRLRCR